MPIVLPPHPTDETAANRAALARMRDICMATAERLLVEVQTPPPENTPPQPDRLPKLSAAIEGIARCLRRTIALHERLGQPAPIHRDSNMLSRAAARRRILRELQDTITVLVHPDEQENLRNDLYDRFERPELDDEIAHRPIRDIITDMRRDLGLEKQTGKYPWPRRNTAQWVELCTRAAGRPHPPP